MNVRKKAIVIGGDGLIGSTVAQTLIERDVDVLIVARNESKLKCVCEKMGGKGIDYLVADVTKDSIESIFSNALKILSRVDIFVYSVGVHIDKDFFSIDSQQFDECILTGVKSFFMFSQIVSGYMIENKIEGNIIAIGSKTSFFPAITPNQISKWALRGFSLGLADALSQSNIKVNMIAPARVVDYEAEQSNSDVTTKEEIKKCISIILNDKSTDIIV